MSCDAPQWWVDQNAVECAYRFSTESKLKDIKPIIDNYVIVPTGSEEAKRNALSKAL